MLRCQLPVTFAIVALGVAGCGDRSVSPPVKALPAVMPDGTTTRYTHSADPSPHPPRQRKEMKTPQGLVVEMPVLHDCWADRMVAHRFGDPAPKISRNPWRCLGAPDYKPDDPLAVRDATHLSLGHGGEVIVEFVDNVLIDAEGDDLVIFEVGPAVEPTNVWISEDGMKWIEIGAASGAKSTLDIAKFVRPEQKYRFVKLIDAKGGRSNDSEQAGADIDAVGAINSLPVAGAPSRAVITSWWTAPPHPPKQP